jgi:hypothetical protein
MRHCLGWWDCQHKLQSQLLQNRQQQGKLNQPIDLTVTNHGLARPGRVLSPQLKLPLLGFEGWQLTCKGRQVRANAGTNSGCHGYAGQGTLQQSSIRSSEVAGLPANPWRTWHTCSLHLGAFPTGGAQHCKHKIPKPKMLQWKGWVQAHVLL